MGLLVSSQVIAIFIALGLGFRWSGDDGYQLGRNGRFSGRHGARSQDVGASGFVSQLRRLCGTETPPGLVRGGC